MLFKNEPLVFGSGGGKYYGVNTKGIANNRVVKWLLIRLKLFEGQLTEPWEGGSWPYLKKSLGPMLQNVYSSNLQPFKSNTVNLFYKALLPW
jgi:hypothetical protein